MEKGSLQYKIECSIHKDSLLEAINITQNLKGSHLKCIECIQDENISPNLFIPISKIENSSEQTVLSNWPPLAEGLIKKLNFQMREQNEHLRKTKENVLGFYKEFKEEVLSVILQKEQESLDLLQTHQEKINKSIAVYNHLSNKDKLKDILHNYEKDQKSQDQLLGKLISTKNEEKQQNSKFLEDALTESAHNILTLNESHSFRQDIIKAIQSFNIVNSTKQILKPTTQKTPNTNTNTEQHNQVQNQNKEQQQQSAVPSRKQSSSSIQQNQHQNKQPQVVINQNSNKVDSTSNHPIQKNMLAEQIKNPQNKQHQQQHEQHYTPQQQTAVEEIPKLQPLSSKRKLQFEIINSRFEQSDQAVIKKNERGEYVIKNLYKQCVQQYSDFIFERNKMYLVDIDIYNGSESGEQYIGLIKDSCKDEQHLNKSAMCFLPMEDVWIDSYSSVISGNRIRHHQYQDPISIQIQIHLKNKFVQFMDLPNKTNIVQIKPSNIDLSEHYRLSTHLCKQNDRIVIKNISVVDSF